MMFDLEVPLTPQLRQCLPPPPATLKRAAEEETVARLLQAAAPQHPPKKGMKTLLPFKFVTRGDGCTKIAQGDATMPEYLDALFKLRVDEDCPQLWKDHRINHLAELSEMATVWDWPTC